MTIKLATLLAAFHVADLFWRTHHNCNWGAAFWQLSWLFWPELCYSDLQCLYSIHIARNLPRLMKTKTHWELQYYLLLCFLLHFPQFRSSTRFWQHKWTKKRYARGDCLMDSDSSEQARARFLHLFCFFLIILHHPKQEPRGAHRATNSVNNTKISYFYAVMTV